MSRVCIKIGIAFPVLMLVSCGRDSSSSDPDAVVSAHFSVHSALHANSETSVESDAPGFSGEIVGCASGFKTVVASTDTQEQLYFGDRGCRVRILALELSGRQLALADPNADFSEGSIVRFQDQTGDILLLVKKQIPDPITGPFETGMAITEIASSSTPLKILDFGIGPAQRIRRGAYGSLTPNFAIKKTRIVRERPDLDAFALSFDLECHSRLTGVGTTRVACEGLRLRDITFALVEDRYSGKPCRPGEFEKCYEIMRRHEKAVCLCRDVVAPGRTLPRGGIRTPEAERLALLTPAEVMTHPKMILMLRSPWGIEYFPLNLAVERHFEE